MFFFQAAAQTFPITDYMMKQAYLADWLFCPFETQQQAQQSIISTIIQRAAF